MWFTMATRTAITSLRLASSGAMRPSMARSRSGSSVPQVTVWTATPRSRAARMAGSRPAVSVARPSEMRTMAETLLPFNSSRARTTASLMFVCSPVGALSAWRMAAASAAGAPRVPL